MIKLKKKALKPRIKARFKTIDEDGNELDETSLSGLYHFESGTDMALTNTSSGGYIFATDPRNGGDIWLYKWGESEEIMNIKIDLDSGFGGQSIERTNDNGFIISSGSTIIKTDSNLSF